jgi:hypothetical protein
MKLAVGAPRPTEGPPTDDGELVVVRCGSAPRGSSAGASATAAVAPVSGEAGLPDGLPAD